MENAHLVFCGNCRMALRDEMSQSPCEGEARPPAPFRPRRAAATDNAFAGILADVFRCGCCGELIVRPARLRVSRGSTRAA
jgi:hypothetical protein